MNPTILNQPQVINADGTISLPFSATDDKYTFADAIVGSADFINGLTPEQILEMQTQRWNNWYAIVTAVDDTQPTQE